MIELGLVKAKRKDGEGWVEGYFFKHDKFNNGKDVMFSVLRSGQNGLGEFMERPVEGYPVYEETTCFYTTAKTTSYNDKIYQGDILNVNNEFEGVVFWDEKEFSFMVSRKDGGNGYLLSDCLQSEVIGNIYDEFNLSKKEKKALKKAKAVKNEA